MRRTTRVLGAALLGLLIAPLGHAGPSGSIYENHEAGTPGLEQAGDITHVANIPHTSGSDIEFATFTVTKLDGGATGSPVCKTVNPDGTCAELATEARDFAFVGRHAGGPGSVIDITNPEAPVKVADLPCSMYQNDIQIWNNLLLQAADGTNGSCKKFPTGTQTGVTTGISDISNPRQPKFLGKLTEGRGAHNHTVHPTQPILYISNSDLPSTSAVVHIWDFSNPAAPVKVKDWTINPALVFSPHDITFNATGTRAYAASVSHTDIFNTEDPKNPVLISFIANEGISIAHQADPTPDGNYLLITDELGGGSVPGASPGGPVHVYDIRNEAVPIKVGAFTMDCVVVSCDTGAPVHVTTAHVFRINPDGYTMAIGWYNDGLAVIDYSDIRGPGVVVGAQTGIFPRVVGQIKMPGANVWAAKMWQERHPGYVFANDQGRGFDVFKVSSMTGGFLASGTLRAGHPANYTAENGVTRADFQTNCDFSPVTNGVDGWVTKIPAKYADGNYQLTVKKMMFAGADYDLDLVFFDGNCAFLGAADEAGTDQTGDIPEGTKYAMASEYEPGANARINFYVAPKPAE